MSSNCSAWQEGKVRSRKDLIVGVLNSMRTRKTSGLKVTELAENVCETIRAVEERACQLSGKPYRPINSSTLLRPGGKYRKLLDSFLVDKKFESGDLEIKISNPIANRLLKSKACEVSNLSVKLGRAQKKIELLTKKIDAEQRPLVGGCFEVDGLGRSAKALFDLLIGTGIFKFDESAGEILFVSRTRKVAISRQDIAPYLNWRKSRMTNTIDADLSP